MSDDLARFEDDGGPVPVEPLTAGEVHALWTDALGRAVRALADAVRPLLDAFRHVEELASAGRWWPLLRPYVERPVDRARRQRVARQMRIVARRAARRRRRAAA